MDLQWANLVQTAVNTLTQMVTEASPGLVGIAAGFAGVAYILNRVRGSS